MIVPNAQDKLLTMWDLYICTDNVNFADIPKLTASNHATVKAKLDTYNYATVGHIRGFSVTHTKENETIINAENCGAGELARLVQKTPKFTWTWLELNNRAVFDKLLWLDSLSVASTPVTGATFVVPTGFTYNKFYALNHQNGDGSAPTITSVVGSVNAWPLVAGTDYVLVNQGGVYGVIILDSADVTTTAQTITVTYNYTPSASTLDGYNVNKTGLNYVLCKFVSCKNQINDTQAIQDTIYIIKAVIDGDVVEGYVDMANQTELAGSEISLIGVLGGWYLKDKATVAL